MSWSAAFWRPTCCSWLCNTNLSHLRQPRERRLQMGPLDVKCGCSLPMNWSGPALRVAISVGPRGMRVRCAVWGGHRRRALQLTPDAALTRSLANRRRRAVQHADVVFSISPHARVRAHRQSRAYGSELRNESSRSAVVRDLSASQRVVGVHPCMCTSTPHTRVACVRLSVALTFHQSCQCGSLLEAIVHAAASLALQSGEGLLASLTSNPVGGTYSSFRRCLAPRSILKLGAGGGIANEKTRLRLRSDLEPSPPRLW